MCLSLCATCTGCNFISVSLPHRDCSWHRRCRLEALHADMGGGSDAFRSGAVDRATLRNVHQAERALALTAPSMAFLYPHESPLAMVNFDRAVDRFAPTTFLQAMAAVYTTWNLLDRMVLDRNNTIVRWAFGMFLPVQVEKLVKAVRTPGVRTYCEVGFNGGHTAAAVLASTGHVRVHSFDIGAYGDHTVRNAAWLHRMHPQRFHFTKGDSAVTLPAFSKKVAGGRELSCDVILVDGDHSEAPTYNDLLHFRRAASHEALVILDDLDSPSGLAVLRAHKERWLSVRSWFVYHTNSSPPAIPCQRCYTELPNLTVLPDPNRQLAPCMRWVYHGCQQQVARTGNWDSTRCRMCHEGAAWGLAQFSAQG